MFSRFTGATVRASLVVILIAVPAMMLANTTPDTAQAVVLFCIAAAVFTFVEYNASSPSLTEFRDAPPFNRVRFMGLAATIITLSIIAKDGTDPTTITRLFTHIGGSLAESMDFPYSPVRLAVLMLPDGANDALVESVRTAAGLSYLVSLVSIAAFVIILRVANWPNQRGGFNVWTNLPTFNPSAGGDVVDRLERDGPN